MTDRERLILFAEKLNNLIEVDYGDFKRKVALYLDRLKVELENPTQDMLNKLEAMRRYVLFESAGDIQATRQQLIKGVLQLLQKDPKGIEKSAINVALQGA